MPIGPRYFRARRSMRAKHFAHSVWDAVDTSEVLRKFPRLEFDSTFRLTIMTLVSKVRRDKRIHFTSTERTILLQIFFELTKRQLRSLTLAEVQEFLYVQFQITHVVTLGRLARAAELIRGESKGSYAHGVGPLQFLQLLSTLLRGNTEDRAELAFYAMDLDGDGRLRTYPEIWSLLKDTYDAKIAASNAEIDPEEPVRETVRFLQMKTKILADGSIGLSTFKRLVHREPWLIESLLPCLPRDLENVAFQSIFTSTAEVPVYDSRNSSLRRSRIQDGALQSRLILRSRSCALAGGDMPSIMERKIFARILLNRLNGHLEQGLLPENQCCFRSHRGTTEMIFTTRQLQEKCQEMRTHLYTNFVDLMNQLQEKCQEMRTHLYTNFVDLTNAFDTVLWYTQGQLLPCQPPAPSPISGHIDSVLTTGSGGGGESAVAAAQGYYHLKLIHAQVTVLAPPGVEHTVDLVEIDGLTVSQVAFMSFPLRGIRVRFCGTPRGGSGHASHLRPLPSPVFLTLS
ncbi:unnamed protein product [Schistocephalus solidus]|uniref:EF-hand domain-containing protein n=1 Tax=Schistocephalus solidus TaxID=70667 RepID=A0A183TDL5_SCHSO|nr:unnamed protein product [Schistocephalus solidus]